MCKGMRRAGRMVITLRVRAVPVTRAEFNQPYESSHLHPLHFSLSVLCTTSHSYATSFWSSAIHSVIRHRKHHDLYNLFCNHGAQEGEYEEGCRQCKSSPLQSQYMECLLISIQKAEVAAQKQAQASAQVAAKEDQEWNKGAKSNAKK